MVKIITNILGIKINITERDKDIELISNSLKENDLKILLTPNPQIILKARNDVELKNILNSSDFNLSDGIGVVIASKILSLPIKDRITGIDTAEYILSEAAKNGHRVFLLGGRHGVAQKAADKLKAKFEGINICGVHHGYFNKSTKENEKVISTILNSKPDILFVCFGAPLQEKWIFNNKNRLENLKLVAGLGGSLDVWSGNVKRAPRFIRAIGLEWLWRIINEPSRITVIPTIFTFLGLVIMEKINKLTKNETTRGRNTQNSDKNK